MTMPQVGRLRYRAGAKRRNLQVGGVRRNVFNDIYIRACRVIESRSLKNHYRSAQTVSTPALWMSKLSTH